MEGWLISINWFLSALLPHGSRMWDHFLSLFSHLFYFSKTQIGRSNNVLKKLYGSSIGLVYQAKGRPSKNQRYMTCTSKTIVWDRDFLHLMTPKFYRLSALDPGGKIWGHQVQKIPVPYYMFLLVYLGRP